MDMRTHRHENSQPWKLTDITTKGPITHKILQLKLTDIKTHRHENSQTWHLKDMATYRHDNSQTWQLTDMTTHRHDKSYTWQLTDITNSYTWLTVTTFDYFFEYFLMFIYIICIALKL